MYDIDREDLENGLDEFQANEVLRWKEIIERLNKELNNKTNMLHSFVCTGHCCDLDSMRLPDYIKSIIDDKK